MASTSAITSSNRIAVRFAGLRARQRKALVPYITAGYPDSESSLALLEGLEDAGADIVEVGVPFSDPIADGPVIQASSEQALSQGMTLDGTLELVNRARSGVPVVLFTYLNPLLAAGDDVLDRCAQAGVDGVLLTDLPLGADPEREHWLRSSSLSYIRLVAPTTPAERMRQISVTGSGFVYLVSRLGVTGMRAELPADLAATASRLRAVTPLPVCIGFGVSTPEQARSAASLADGVVVGSALVREAGNGVDAALAMTRRLREGLDRV